MMMNFFPPTNISEKLTSAQEQQGIDIVHAINELIAPPSSVNTFDFEALETERIFHIESIKSTCIDFRLRFLDLKYFKNDLPKEAFEKITALEREHNTKLSGYKVMAPSKLFRLKNTDDPLLFVPLGNNYFYLIHQWGDDLHPFRKTLVWPFKNIWNLIVTLLCISLVLTSLTPIAIFSKTNSWSTFWMIYFFMFKAIASVVLFCGFALGKNFNPAIWNSKYNKS